MGERQKIIVILLEKLNKQREKLTILRGLKNEAILNNTAYDQDIKNILNEIKEIDKLLIWVENK